MLRRARRFGTAPALTMLTNKPPSKTIPFKDKPTRWTAWRVYSGEIQQKLVECPEPGASGRDRGGFLAMNDGVVVWYLVINPGQASVGHPYGLTTGH